MLVQEATSIAKIATNIYSFVSGSTDVNDRFTALHDEASHLERTAKSLESLLARPDLDAFQDGEVWADARDSLAACEDTLQSFDKKIRSLRASKADGWRPKDLIRQGKADLNEEGVGKLRSQLVTHRLALQTIIGIVNVHISSKSPEIILSVIVPRLEELRLAQKAMQADLRTTRAAQAASAHVNEEEVLILQNSSKLSDTATRVVEETSSIVEESMSTISRREVTPDDSVSNAGGHLRSSNAKFRPAHFSAFRNVSSDEPSDRAWQRGGPDRVTSARNDVQAWRRAVSDGDGRSSAIEMGTSSNARSPRPSRAVSSTAELPFPTRAAASNEVEESSGEDSDADFEAAHLNDYINIAEDKLASGDYRAAEDFFKRALSQPKLFAHASSESKRRILLYKYARVLSAQGKVDEAIQHLQSLWRYKVRDESERSIRLHSSLYLATLFLSQNNSAAATEACERCIRPYWRLKALDNYHRAVAIMVSIYEAKGDVVEAAVWRKKLPHKHVDTSEDILWPYATHSPTHPNHLAVSHLNVDQESVPDAESELVTKPHNVEIVIAPHIGQSLTSSLATTEPEQLSGLRSSQLTIISSPSDRGSTDLSRTEGASNASLSSEYKENDETDTRSKEEAFSLDDPTGASRPAQAALRTESVTEGHVSLTSIGPSGMLAPRRKYVPKATSQPFLGLPARPAAFTPATSAQQPLALAILQALPHDLADARTEEYADSSEEGIHGSERLVHELQYFESEDARLDKYLQERPTTGIRLHNMIRDSWRLSSKDMNTLRALLSGPEVNEVAIGGETCLLVAAEHDPLIMQDVLGAGGDINARTKDGNTALHLVIATMGSDERSTWNSKENALELLIEAGANVKAVNKKGESPLHLAAAHRMGVIRHVMNKLIVAGAEVNAEDEEGWTPLMSFIDHNTYAHADVWKDHGRDILNDLVGHGALVNRQSPDILSPIAIAAASENSILVSCLLEHGADPNVSCAELSSGDHKTKLGGFLLVTASLLIRASLNFMAILLDKDLRRRLDDIVVALLRHGVDAKSVYAELHKSCDTPNKKDRKTCRAALELFGSYLKKYPQIPKPRQSSKLHE